MYDLFSDNEDLEYECLGCRGSKSFSDMVEQFSTKLNDVAHDKLTSLLNAIIKHGKSYVLHHIPASTTQEQAAKMTESIQPAPLPVLCLHQIEVNLKNGDYVTVNQVIDDLEQVSEALSVTTY